MTVVEASLICRPEQLRAAAAWAEVGEAMGDVQLTHSSDLTLEVAQGDDAVRFDENGDPCSS